MKHPGGAPSKITAELLAKAKAYAEGGWRANNAPVPTVERLALELGLYRSYLYAVPELSDTLEQIQAIQASEALEKGLLGTYNSNIVKLLLSSKHGYVEKSSVEQDHKSSDGTMSPKEPVNKSTLDEVVKTLKEKTAEEAE